MSNRKRLMDTEQHSVVKRKLASWIFDGNTGLQISLLIIILMTVGIRIVPLEMQKRIVNEAINLRKVDLLAIYCSLYLAAVLSASILKFLINTLQTRISENATASMRKELYHHILRLPLGFFRNTQPGTVVNSLINDLTLPGNFVGMAIATPSINILTLLAFAVYLFFLNPVLALVSLTIYPVMLYIIPLLQKKVNSANNQRVNVSRTLSSKIVESVSGIHEVQANGAFALENTKFDALVEHLKQIRVRWSVLKFAVKVTNNLFTSMGPVLVFVLGGYLAIKGNLELGSLVAFLSAQEKLYDPWKELIEFYQVYQDGSVVYYKTMDYFDVPVSNALLPAGRPVFDLEASIVTENMGLETEDGLPLLSDITLSLEPGEHIALVGFSGSGKSSLALSIAQLYAYTSGHATLGNHEISELTKADITKHVGLVSQSPFIFSGTIRENLLYSYAALHQKNGILDQALEPSLDDLISVLQQSGLFVDVLRFGLSTIVTDPMDVQVPVIIRMRKNFNREFGDQTRQWIEFFHSDAYLSYAGIADNIIFGTPLDDRFSLDRLSESRSFMEVLDRSGLTDPLISLGRDLAEQTVDILKNITPNKVFFEQSPISMEKFETYRSIVKRIKNKTLDQLDVQSRSELLDLALRFSPGRHKTAVMPAALKQLILEARERFNESISAQDPSAVTFFQEDDYIHSQSILNNILFGLTKTSSAHAQEKINQMIVQLLIEEDLLEAIIETGMQFDVGNKGNRLSGGQCQKLAIARTFLKAPPVMIFDEATSALDNQSQQRIQNLLSRQWKGKSTLIAVVHRLDIIKDYDKIAFMKSGKIVEMGSYDDLMARKGFLYELIHERH